MVGTVDVVIPILDYDPNMYWIVQKLQRHPGITRIILTLDPSINSLSRRTITTAIYQEFNKVLVVSGSAGKGQNVLTAMHVVSTPRVMFCDCDYLGLNYDHITQLTKPETGMIIGVPTYPLHVPTHVLMSWPWVSGFRTLPREIVPDNLHGYLMEHQLNTAAKNAGLIIEKFLMAGLVSPFKWPLPAWRQEAMENDFKWGKANGIL